MTIPEIIVDTSALIAFFVKSETNYLKAKQFIQQNSQYRWIILETVFDETVTWFRTKISPQASIQIGQVLRTEHIYVNLSDDDDEKIWQTFCKYDDKNGATQIVPFWLWHNAFKDFRYLHLMIIFVKCRD
jgi:predicted nucleic acid-binding protein